MDFPTKPLKVALQVISAFHISYTEPTPSSFGLMATLESYSDSMRECSIFLQHFLLAFEVQSQCLTN